VLSPGMFAEKSLIMHVRDCRMCFNRSNLFLLVRQEHNLCSISICPVPPALIMAQAGKIHMFILQNSCNIPTFLRMTL